MTNDEIDTKARHMTSELTDPKTVSALRPKASRPTPENKLYKASKSDDVVLLSPRAFSA